MAEKACKQCKLVHEGNTCQQCGSQEFSEHYKCHVIVLNPENSEIAQNLKITKKGKFAIKLG